jgi:pimeloyl-ACP methyl ester carboxylesterase
MPVLRRLTVAATAATLGAGAGALWAAARSRPVPRSAAAPEPVADDVAAVLEHLGVGPAVAVGYSMGGAVAQLLWQRHPQTVRGPVLCATAASWSESLRMRWGWRAMGALQVARDGDQDAVVARQGVFVSTLRDALDDVWSRS